MLRRQHTVPAGAILLAMVFPTALTLTYFVLLAGSPGWLQQAVYAVGKTLQFAFPALVFTVMRLRPRGSHGANPAPGISRRLAVLARQQVIRLTLRFRQLSSPRSGWFRRQARWLSFGLAFGLLVLAGMFGLYEWLWQGNPAFADATRAIRQKIIGLGIGRLWMYAAVGVFYALCHSGLEEYYWRWFVFGQLRSREPLARAVTISSLAFMAHHVILLATFFGWASPWAYAFSLAVAVGGAVWAWLYERSGSLVSSWVSHLVVDAAIFLVGFDLARDLLSGPA